MLQTVLLLLSLLTVQCGGCGFDCEGVKNIKRTIDHNPTGFVRLLCCSAFSLQCCVFPAAVVLLESWHVLLRNLWDEHLNHSLILDLKQTLDRIISRNKYTGKFQEETDLDKFSTLHSSPEELLNLTSELFARWLQVESLPSIETCTLPTLPPSVERKDYAISAEEDEGQPDRMIDITQPLSNGGPPSLSYYASVWSPLLFRLYWWLLP
uniref:Uncharacterized protein n=1 Tax=Dicentrarchus labrax TaxID=13489 RepID=A0A8C4DLT6_DICLA